jgi:hypothetical protein
MNDIQFVGNCSNQQDWCFNFSFELAELPAPQPDGRIRLTFAKSKKTNKFYCKVNDFVPDPSKRKEPTHAAPAEIGPSAAFPPTMPLQDNEELHF